MALVSAACENNLSMYLTTTDRHLTIHNLFQNIKGRLNVSYLMFIHYILLKIIFLKLFIIKLFIINTLHCRNNKNKFSILLVYYK